MANKKKMIDQVKYFEGMTDPNELAAEINAWLGSQQDVQDVHIYFDSALQAAFIHYRKRV